MKGPAKLSEHVYVNITHEQAMWLDELVRESGADGRGPLVRSMLQTLMDEDKLAWLIAERLSSPEAKEAISAFFQKRKPDFSQFS